MQTQGGNARQPKATWFLMFAAFVWFQILLVGFGAFLAMRFIDTKQPAPGADALKAISYMVTPLAVVTAIYWSRAKLMNLETDPQSFTRDSIVALAIAELGLLFAVIAFMRSDPLQILIFGAVIMVVDFVLILPNGLRYWNAREPK
jgi:hypothetical protein